MTIGNSDAIQVGDWAVAIGSPFGLEASVTAGIVSATGREINAAQQFQRFIQTDAAINPGNSGGPLLDIRGEVIGVNTMIATQTGGNNGIGFALPINMAVHVYNDIIRTGRVTRGSIGISWSKADKPDLLKALGADHGVLVGDVHKDGPAEKAGIKADDIILAMDGKPIKDGDDLVTRVAESPIGTVASFDVDRGGKKMSFKVTILDRTEVFKDRVDIAGEEECRSRKERSDQPGEIRHRIRTLSDPERASQGLEDKHGVVVTSVDADSFAEEIGLRRRTSSCPSIASPWLPWRTCEKFRAACSRATRWHSASCARAGSTRTVRRAGPASSSRERSQKSREPGYGWPAARVIA